MQKAVVWWCNLVGVSDSQAIQIAVGIIGAVSFLVVALIAYFIVMSTLDALFHAGRKEG